VQTLDHPTAVFRTRQEPVHVAVHFPIGTAITPDVTKVELAPQPVPYTAFHQVGKTAHVRNRPVQNLAISEWLGVMAWPFKLLKVEAMRPPLGAPKPGMMPFTERVNVDMPGQTSVGAMSSIKAPLYTGPQYGKLGMLG
jgi:hypothetical protein